MRGDATRHAGGALLCHFRGAFLVTAIGLGIGAMYVRSMTIMLNEQGTLKQYCYLEHGAFYAVIVLSVLMFARSVVHIPEVVTALGGVAMIGLALRSSVRRNRVVGW